MEDHSGGAPMTQLSDRQGRVSFHDAVGAEKYLQAHSLKGVIQWLAHETIVHRPESPLPFLRDLICKRLTGQDDTAADGAAAAPTPHSRMESEEALAELVQGADIALSKCLQGAATCKDAQARGKARARLGELRTMMDQLSRKLGQGPVQAPVSTGPPSIQILPANDSGGNTRMSAARSLATSGLGSIDAGDSSEDTSDEDSMHTPVEWTTESPSPKTPVEDRPSLGKWTVEDRCNATFSKIDADNDGFLDRKEFETALKKLGMNMGPRAMTALMNKIDVNNDGEISRQEFIDFYKRANAEGADEYIDMDLWGLMKFCCGGNRQARRSVRPSTSVGDDEDDDGASYEAPGHYKYAALVSWLLHASEGFNRRRQNMVKKKEISVDTEMNNYLKGGNSLKKGGLSFTAMEQRQQGSDPDANAKIVALARKGYKIIPDDTWYLCWTLFTMVLILFYMGVVPVRLGFSAYADDNEFVQGREGWYWVDFVADTVFLLDIAMNFFVIIKHGNGEFITSFIDIAIFQIHSKWFYVDLVASFPTSYMSFDEYSTTDDEWKHKQVVVEEEDDGGGLSQLNGVNKLLRLVRIIKLARVFRMVRFMKDFENLAIVNPSSLRLIRLLVVFVIILHFVACGFWAIASMDGFCQNEDECESNIAWYIQKERAQAAHLTTQYMWAFYWAVSAMTGVGYDIEPRTYWQHVYTTVIVVCGMFMNAVLIGSVPGAIENLDRLHTERKLELDNINDYLRKQHVPPYLMRSVRSYYEYLHGCDYDMRIAEENLLQNLPESLRTRVRVATAIRAIERIPLFTDLHASCKIQIIQSLIPLIAVPGQRLALQDDIGDAMYIIKHGRVQLKRKKQKRGAFRWKSASQDVMAQQDEHLNDVAQEVRRQIAKVAELGAGDFFGENCLIGRKNDTTAVVADYSDLLVSVVL